MVIRGVDVQGVGVRILVNMVLMREGVVVRVFRVLIVS